MNAPVGQAQTTVECVNCDVDRAIDAWKGPHALVLGVSGPQGAGKSYLTEHLINYLHQTRPQLKCIGLLLDDFYLTHAEQLAVSENARRSGNALLMGRGLPGTHDVELALRTVLQLRGGSGPVSVPVYDKSAFSGKGDRLKTWKSVCCPVDVVVFEGWMNGFRPIDETLFPALYFSAGSSIFVHKMHHLLAINTDLAAYEQFWAMFDRFIFLHTDDYRNIYRWRQQQEAALIAQGRAGMTPEQVTCFVDRYMVMYALYYERLCRKGVAPKGCNFCIEIDDERRVVGHHYF